MLLDRVNQSAVQIAFFVRALLSGGFAPLWFFPHWFVTMGAVLPFQGTLTVPLSIYVARLTSSEVPAALAFSSAGCWRWDSSADGCVARRVGAS